MGKGEEKNVGFFLSSWPWPEAKCSKGGVKGKKKKGGKKDNCSPTSCRKRKKKEKKRGALGSANSKGKVPEKRRAKFVHLLFENAKDSTGGGEREFGEGEGGKGGNS